MIESPLERYEYAYDPSDKTRELDLPGEHAGRAAADPRTKSETGGGASDGLR